MEEPRNNPYDLFRLPGDLVAKDEGASEVSQDYDVGSMDDCLNTAARSIFAEVLGDEPNVAETDEQEGDVAEFGEDADQDMLQKPAPTELPRLQTMPKLSGGKGSKGGKGSGKGGKGAQPELIGSWSVTYSNGKRTVFHVAAHGRVTLSEHDGTGVAFLEPSLGNDLASGWTNRIKGHYRLGVHELLKVHQGKLNIAHWDGRAWMNGVGEYLGTRHVPQPVASAKVRVTRPLPPGERQLLEVNAARNRSGIVQLARARLAKNHSTQNDQETISNFVESNKLANEVELGLKMFESGKLQKFFCIVNAHSAEFQAKSNDPTSRNKFVMVLLGKVDQSVEQLVRQIAAFDEADKRKLQGLASVMFTDREGDVSTISGDDGVMLWNAAGHGTRRVTSLGLRPDKGRGDGLTIVGPFGAAALVDPPPGNERRRLVQEVVEIAKSCGVPVTGDGSPGNYSAPGVADAARQAFFDASSKGNGGKGVGKKGSGKMGADQHVQVNQGMNKDALEEDLASLEGDVNLFLDESQVDDRAAASLRSQLPGVQRLVLNRGVLHDCQNPSATLMSRIQTAKDQAKDMGGFELGAAPDLEDFILRNGLDERASAELRAEAPHIQERVMRRGGIDDCRNPSAVCLARIRDEKKQSLQEHQIASTAAPSKAVGPRAVGLIKREKSRSPLRTGVPPRPSGPPPRPSGPPPPAGLQPASVLHPVGASVRKGGKGGSQSAFGPISSEHRSRSPRRPGSEDHRGSAGKSSGKADKDDRGKTRKFGSKGKDNGVRAGRYGGKGGKHHAESRGGGKIASWLRGIDRGGILMRYLPALEREFENLSELAAAMINSADASTSVVACIEPAVFEALGVEPLGHRLLLAKGIVALNDPS